MGATNSTTNYSLSQFIATDKPAWLQDYNGDMLKIDTAIKNAATAASTAQNTASTALTASGTNASDITSLQTTVSGLNTTVTNIQLAINTIQSLIGNGTPTTTDQTIIGAINELNERDSYKSAESVIGKFNNKTLYRRVLEANVNFLANQYGTYQFTGINGMVTIMRLEAVVHQTDDSTVTGSSQGGGNTTFVYANGVSNLVGLNHLGAVDCDHITIIIEYTKD